MNGASKILTVSYGTFSCTLEGFDDPFNTMKAIAEYFRDLAAEDRYFGAEPPQPDAAMLHRIAEREIQRRVEAKIQDNGVILRAEDGSPSLAHRATPTGAEALPQPVVEMPARSVAPAAKPAPTLANADSDPFATTEAGAESVAEKLSRLRKAAAENTHSLMTVAAQSAEHPENEDAGFEPEQAAHSANGQVLDGAVPSPDLTQYEDHLVEDAAPTFEEVVAGDVPPEQQSGSEGTFDADIDAEDLADLMALAPQGYGSPDSSSAREIDFASADAAQPAGPPQARTDTALNADLPEAETPLDDNDDLLLATLAAETAGAFADPWPLTDNTTNPSEEAPAGDNVFDDALLESLEALVDPEDDRADEASLPDLGLDELPGTPVDEAQPAQVQNGAETQPTTAQTVFADELMAPEWDQAAQSNQTISAETAGTNEAADIPSEQRLAQEATAPAEPASVVPARPMRPVRSLRPTSSAGAPASATVPTEQTSATIAETESRTPISVEKLQRARARVIKIRRVDAPVATTSTAPAAVSSPAAPILSNEAEADLAAELAAVEEESSSKAKRSTLSDAALNARPVQEPRLVPPSDDVAVTRLMAEASTKMEVPDTKRRQSAIAHLKAAVAATIAERRATGSTLAGNGSERMGAYRDDLAKVVRPAAATPSPVAERPAPLVLVSEQRIDRPAQPAPIVAPVRPRRPMVSGVATALAAEAEFDDIVDSDDSDEDADNIFEADSGFADFADRLGASDLRDLLEAAAAYIACIEGRDSFTRPQLMRHIGAATDGVTREDGLRSFGILLRDGVFERSRRGQFAINEGSPMLAEARKFAG